MAHSDTTQWLIVCLVLGACSQVTRVEDAGRAQDAGTPIAAECQTNTDCVLVQHGCCATCLPPGWNDAVATPKSNADALRKKECPAGPVACGPCPDADPDPLAPLLAAACVAQHCQLVDLRADAISSCTTDSDCVAASRGCCPASSDAPAEYVGVHDGADRALLACFPVPPCVPPQPHAEPVAFCAADNHCAVRRR